MQGGIFIVIYIDVLFVINFFITFLLLQLTAKLCKKDVKIGRFVLSAVFGGCYSLIILINDMNSVISVVLKILSTLIIVAIAFKFYRVKSFLFCSLCFLFSSFVFLGIILALYFATGNSAFTVNNSVVYFNIGAKSLLFSALFAYLLACFVVRLHNRSIAKNEIYTIEITAKGKTVRLFAFADNGNKLREPFSDSPIIIVNENMVKDLVGDNVRLVPTNTVNGKSLLVAFKPDKILLKTSKGEFVVENVYVALSNELNSKKFSAVFNPEILSV